MKLAISKWSILFVFSLFILSCATIPSPDKGKGTLLVIPLEHEMEISEGAWYDYYLEIAEVDTDKKVRAVVISKNKDFLLVQNLKPGDYYISGYKWKTSNQMGDLHVFYKTFAPFSLEKGVMTMAPIGFGWKSWKDDSGNNRYTMRVHKIMDGAIQKRTLDKLRADSSEELAAWEIKEFEPESYLDDVRRVAETAELKPFEIEFEDVLTGDIISSESLKGKVVVVDFWATWCGPCIGELPNMLSLYETWKDQGVEFIGISLDEDPQVLAEFCRREGLTWPQYCEPGKAWDTQFSKSWSVYSIPRIFILDKEGRVVSMEARGRLEELIPMVLDL